ncbi:MAG: hypothetical protein PWQ67_589 [Clostridia bacterium]|jgi:hypothetical protein|nr:hypothetical protein [Clostridia bacterium]MDN5322135.1 hypothetical protein [Clostridia bacterium]
MPDSIILAKYTISLISVVNNTNESQTWTYTISKTNNPNPEIKQLLFVLCADPSPLVLACTGPATVSVDTGKPGFSSLPPIIKWINLNNENVTGTYSFTLKGCYEKTQIPIIVKTDHFHTGTITGPSCKKFMKKNSTDDKDTTEHDVKIKAPFMSTRGIRIFD